MSKLHLSRRDILRSAAAMAAITALGIDPKQVLGADQGVLKIRMGADLQVLDPGYEIGGTETSVLYACLPRLAVPMKEDDGTWGWRPSDYVEKVGQDDPLHISFTLKPGLMWSNGAGELTADDVKFSYDRMLKADFSTRWPTLDHVDVKDKYNGTIVLKAPFVATWLMGLASDSGSIVPKVLVEKMKDQKYTIPMPAQLGPYTMTDWKPKQKAVLKANPDWIGAKPYFQEIHLVDVEDSKAAELAFEAGELDCTAIPPDTAARYGKSLPPHAKLLNQPGPFYTWMGMNTQNPKLSDSRVRKAIQRAIDVDSILQAGYAGVCPRANGVVPIGVLGHRDKSNYSYNPDDAKALLKEAGVSGLSLEIKTLSGEVGRVAACQIIQSNLGDIGITVKVTPVDSGPFWNLGLESKGSDWKTLELWIMQFQSAPDPADSLQWFQKSQVGVWNWERWSDPEFEALWAKGLEETNRTKRAAIYVRMQEIMENTGAYVWLTFDPMFYAYKDNMQPGFEPAGDPLLQMFRGA
jgi:peptide/nickel transport system substrate-binding protein